VQCVTSVYVYIDDQPTNDVAAWKILNGDISAMGHPIHFMFGFGVGFFGGRQIE